MTCTSCQQTPCVCVQPTFVVPPASWTFVNNNQPSLSIFAPDETHAHPRFESITGRIVIADKLDYGTINLIEMYLQGKSFDEHKQDYVDAILKLPWVDGDNLKACQTFDRLRELFSIFREK